MADPRPFLGPPCETCGHGEVLHNNSIPLNPLHPIRYGSCRDCACQQFTPRDEKAAA